MSVIMELEMETASFYISSSASLKIVILSHATQTVRYEES
jgi:hypothetical protein